jgi:hypothetical protein
MATKTDAEIREDAAISNDISIRMLFLVLHLLEHIEHAVLWGQSLDSDIEHPDN